MKVRSKAPLRLGFAGGGSDVSPYCDQFGGAILNATIDMYAYCTIEPLDTDQVIFSALDRDEYFEAKATDELVFDGTLDLHRGVYQRIVKQFRDGEPLPCKITTYSDAPAGSGLGSSSTIVVAILTAFAEWLNLPLGEYDIAHLAFEIERHDVGLTGGRQDQYAATFGGFNYMEFSANDRVLVNPLRIKDWINFELANSLLLYYTGVSRASANIIDEQIDRIQRQDTDSVEATHQIKRDALKMKEFLLRGEITKFGEVLGRSWLNKKRMASKINSPEIERVMECAKKHGAFAGKVSGAGGGGFIMLMVDPLDRVRLKSALDEQAGQTMNFHFEESGAQAWLI